MSWDEHYVQRNTPWDQGQASAVVLEMAKHLDAGAHILVPGCGRGYEVENLADRGHRVVGLDVSPTALAQAAERVGERPSVEWVEADLFTLPKAWSHRFDAVAEHTCFCAIDPAQTPAYVEAMWQVLKPGGVLFGAFLHFEGGGPPFGTNPEAVRAVFADRFRVEYLEPAELFGPRAVPQLAARMIAREESR